VKAFAATADGQGARCSDFCRAAEGELVIIPFECAVDRFVGIDRGCGCRRAMVGVDSAEGTTTFRVIELEVTMKVFHEMIVAAVLSDVWRGRLDRYDASVLAEEVVERAAAFDLGPVLERRGDDIHTRLRADSDRSPSADPRGGITTEGG
jgi:hypothetical protein